MPLVNTPAPADPSEHTTCRHAVGFIETLLDENVEMSSHQTFRFATVDELTRFSETIETLTRDESVTETPLTVAAEC